MCLCTCIALPEYECVGWEPAVHRYFYLNGFHFALIGKMFSCWVAHTTIQEPSSAPVTLNGWNVLGGKRSARQTWEGRRKSVSLLRWATFQTEAHFLLTHFRCVWACICGSLIFLHKTKDKDNDLYFNCNPTLKLLSERNSRIQKTPCVCKA